MILNRAEFLEEDRLGHRALALDLLEHALLAVEPRAATRRALRRLTESGVSLEGCTILAFGKASRAMAQGALDVCTPRQGVVVGFEEGDLGPLTAVPSSHPVPTVTAAEHGRAVRKLVSSLHEEDTVLCLVSGGGSAMLELPVAGVSMEMLAETTASLLASGIPIEELNQLRAQLSCIKGGRLAEAIHPARLLNVVLSDVPGHGASLVASGPTMRPSFDEPMGRMIERRGLSTIVPKVVLEALRREREPVAPHVFEDVRTELAGDNRTAQEALAAEGRRRGVPMEVLPGFVGGEAHEAGKLFYRQCAARNVPMVWGGETTVTVRGDGRGGRNQEFVLGAYSTFGGGLLASFGTDGVDGASEAAGALLDKALVERARTLSLDPRAALAQNDADPFFDAANGRMVTGPTGTNVADLCLYLPDVW